MPKLPDDLRAKLAEALVSTTERWVAARRTCVTCQAFNIGDEICDKFNARPPAKIIAYGCVEYFGDDDIPF